MIRVADYIIERLYEEYVKYIFMVTGRGILYLTDALAKKDGLMGISVHHEQAAAYAAIAYAQYTERIGVCLVSTGCASTNAITGVLNAWQDGVPCVFISGQNMLKETVAYTKAPIRTYGSQENDIIPIVNSITKYAVMITKPEEIVYELDKAIYLAQNGRKGPVWIDIPLDIQNMRIEPKELKRYIYQEEIKDPLKEDIDYIVNCLTIAQRPIVLIGNGVRSAKAIKELEKFVENIHIPLTYAHTATDVYGLSNELSIGAVGSLCGTRAGNFTIQNADLVLVLGCRMSSMTTGEDQSKFAREAKVIIVDIDRDEHTKKNEKIDKLIEADVKRVLEILCKKNLKLVNDIWINKCKHWKKIFPKCEEIYKKSEKVDMYYLSEVFSEALDTGTTFLCDAGIEELIFPSNTMFNSSMRCIHSAMQGAMGFALPASIGAWYAGSKTVVAVIGDGSIMMNLQELETIRYYNLPIKIFVLNNNLYSVIRKRQKDLFRTRTIGTDSGNGVGCPEFSKVADCFGIQYIHIENSYDLKNQVKQALKCDSSVICEIECVEDQEYLRSSYTRDSKKRVVRRPIEDQAPFMAREIFLSEMVIEPIDQ